MGINFEQPTPEDEKPGGRRRLRLAVIWLIIFLGIILLMVFKKYLNSHPN